MARSGVAHVPEGRGTFTTLSVLDNLRLGAWVQRGASPRDLAHVFEFFPRLYERRDQQAGTLSGGEQQMLALGRAMMAKPRLLLLDEPSLGLAPLVAREIFDVLGADERERHDDRRRRAERDARARARRSTPTCSRPAASCSAARPRTLQRDESVRRSYLGY